MEKGNRLKGQTERNEKYLNDAHKIIEGYEWIILKEGLRIKGFDRMQKYEKIQMCELNGLGKVDQKEIFKFVGTLRNGQKHGFGRLVMKKFYIYEGMFEFDLKHGDGKIYDFDNRVWIQGLWEKDYIKEYEKFKGFDFMGRCSRIDNNLFGMQVLKNKAKILIGLLDSYFNVEGFGICLSKKFFQCSVYKNRKATEFEIKFLESSQNKLNLNKIPFKKLEQFITALLKFFDYNASNINLNKLRKYDKKYVKANNISQPDQNKKNVKLKNTLIESNMKIITQKLFNLVKAIEILYNKDVIDCTDCNELELSSFMSNLFSNFWKSMPPQYILTSQQNQNSDLNYHNEMNQSLEININNEYKEEINTSNFYKHILYSNSDTFEGIIENFNESYRGRYTYESKKHENGKCQIYEGELYKGKAHGFGVMEYPDGSRYEGEWLSGYFYGIGIYSLSSGDIYYLEHSEHRLLLNILKAQ